MLYQFRSVEAAQDYINDYNARIKGGSLTSDPNILFRQTYEIISNYGDSITLNPRESSVYKGGGHTLPRITTEKFAEWFLPFHPHLEEQA